LSLLSGRFARSRRLNGSRSRPPYGLAGIAGRGRRSGRSPCWCRSRSGGNTSGWRSRSGIRIARRGGIPRNGLLTARAVAAITLPSLRAGSIRHSQQPDEHGRYDGGCKK